MNYCRTEFQYFIQKRKPVLKLKNYKYSVQINKFAFRVFVQCQYNEPGNILLLIFFNFLLFFSENQNRGEKFYSENEFGRQSLGSPFKGRLQAWSFKGKHVMSSRFRITFKDIGISAVTVLIDGKKEKFGYNDIFPSEKDLNRSVDDNCALMVSYMDKK